MIKVVEWSMTHIDKTVDCPICGKNAVYIGSIGDDYSLVNCDNCDCGFKAYLSYNKDGITLHLKDYETGELLV